jgi:carbon monoxide dehydrogenase subunit G
MELNNDFRVSVPPPDAWKVLTDVERIAPLLPGAQLQEVEGDEYRGIVKVKVGPITAQYKGTATFIEQDEPTGHLVLRASGRDTRGQGNASATITVDMGAEGNGTKVGVVTDLTITGKVAQFGRGVLAEVTEKLINQFVEALEADIQSGSGPDGQRSVGDSPAAAPGAGAPAGESTTASGPVTPEAVAASGPRRIDSAEPQPVDLLDAAGASVGKRLAPLAGVGLLLVVLLALRGRRRKARAAAAAAASTPRHVLPDLSSARAALPDFSSAQEAGRRAAKLAQQAAASAQQVAASAELKELAAARELTRRAAKLAQQAAKLELLELAVAQELTRKAAKRARKATSRK